MSPGTAPDWRRAWWTLAVCAACSGEGTPATDLDGALPVVDAPSVADMDIASWDASGVPDAVGMDATVTVMDAPATDAPVPTDGALPSMDLLPSPMDVPVDVAMDLQMVPEDTSVPAPTTGCGNHVCDGGENCGTCPADCGTCDVVCAHPGTCGGCTATAGCGWCGASHGCMACAGGDCHPVRACAGGWAVNPPECPVGCGDGVCNRGENCGTCPADCGSCAEVCARQATCGGCAATAGCGWCGASGACQACLGGDCHPAGACAGGWAPVAGACGGTSGGGGHRLWVAYDAATSACRGSTDGAYHCLLEHTGFTAMAAAYPLGRTLSFGGSAVLSHGCGYHMGTDATVGQDQATFQCVEDQARFDLHDDDVVLYYPAFGGCVNGRNHWHIPVTAGSPGGRGVSVEIAMNFTGANCGCQTAIGAHEVFEASSEADSVDCCNGQDGCRPQPPPYGWYDLHGCPGGGTYTVPTVPPAGRSHDAAGCTRMTVR